MNGAGQERPRVGGEPRDDHATRPADAARRALRAAQQRERIHGEAEGVEPPAGAEPPVGAEPSAAAEPRAEAQPPAGGADVALPESEAKPTTPRPGDAARAALRRANAERRSTRRADEPEEWPKEGEPAESPEATAPPATAPPAAARRTAPATRPGDIAREALRTARKQAERERTESRATTAAEVRRRSGSPGPARSQEGAAEPSGTEETPALRGAVAAPRPTGARGRRSTRPPAGGRQARDVRALLAGAFELPASAAPRSGSASAAREPGERRGTPSPPSPYETASPSTRPRQGTPEPSAGPRGTPSDAPPATPRYPRSMAAPGRDGELRRTFAALPARPVRDRDRFAETWWGNAWVSALEEGALDAARLARGRAYAGRGNVDAITVTPGLVLAYVQGSRPRPYRVQVRLRTFSDEEWDLFLDAAADRPAHIAALLDKQMPQSLAECGVRLLPGAGDLEPHCSCPDFGHPCKHAAAVCYQTAHLLDRDPFVLLLLRGRGERDLLDALSRRNAARAARADRDRRPAPTPGIRARDALARRTRPPLPAPLPPPAHPEQPPVYPDAPGGPDSFALDQLATDAAARAHALLATGQDPVGELTLWQDAVRLAAARPGSGLTAGSRALYASLAAATERTPADLARAVAAWRQGGREALAVLEEPWDPPAGRFDRARPLLLAADLPAFRPWRNRLTHPDGHVQLRLGQDGLWYAYESEPGRDDWWPRGTPDPDPVGALTGLGAPGEG
ncbi:SWIM zinc finger family protein [Streptomyces sp. NPDC001796]|uniref:SWIM zinc finger family protein n=1 Tax=Streptomyces sp. NPDC001796 TaxID=3364609 RepID=UPI0036A787B4